jgi:hypothetical protein
MTLLPTFTQFLVGAAAMAVMLAAFAVGKFVIWWVTRD